MKRETGEQKIKKIKEFQRINSGLWIEQIKNEEMKSRRNQCVNKNV